MEIPIGEIPIGIRFSPTDEELVNYFLKNKVMGRLPPHNMIIERDLYKESPWNIFNGKDPWVQMPRERTKSLYNFAYLEFKGKKKTDRKKFARKAGNGTWKSVTGPQDIIDKATGVVIGQREMLTYVSKDQSLEGSMGHWYMHQYALTDSSLDTIEGTQLLSTCVLCKITRDDSKKLMSKKPPPSETKKKRARVPDQEGTDYETNTVMTKKPKFLGESSSQPNQYNANDDFFEGVSEEIEQMLINLHG